MKIKYFSAFLSLFPFKKSTLESLHCPYVSSTIVLKGGFLKIGPVFTRDLITIDSKITHVLCWTWLVS